MNKNYIRDLSIATGTVITSYLAGVKFDLAEEIGEFLRKYEHLELDELILPTIIGLVSWGIVATRRVSRGKLENLLKDPLTDLYSRRKFERVFIDYLKVARRNNSYLAVFYLDINNFKQVNDKFGHDTGDKLLKEIAKRIKNETRDIDNKFRFGGDEFVLLYEGSRHFPKISNLNQFKENIETVAKRLSDVLSKPYKISNKKIDFTSASIGVSICREYRENFKKLEQELIKSADNSMYEAKSHQLDYVIKIYENRKKQK